MELTAKTVVITGAARGLGRAMAERLAGRGAALALADQDEDGLRETRARCEQAGAQVRQYPVDITDESQVERCFSDVVEDFGTLHGLVNNAGITRDGLLVKAKEGRVEKKMGLEDWDAVSQVDMRGVFLCAREGAARMIEHNDPEGAGRGVIVNVSSISRAGNFGQTNYSAAKAGVASMTVAWAKELAAQDIRVGAVAPGFCRTRMVEAMPEKVLDKLRARIPAGRLGDPDEVAHAVQFILENDYFNGRVLEVDGGLRL